ncbi:MAG: hypothetical protein KJ914_02555 [Gammaproteobacteria bacterium]|nr:hypothetical protein [Gammaproteobacteria bacterium]MBU1722602.1 hypothetical protein [Gammaproteobacteria bacterium]MBU2007074.1 hypothetical protein [Gammaproteobacteria bacterium]
MFKMKPLASSIALSLLTGIAVAAAPGGAILQNKVTATYSDIGGKTYTAESNIVEISIREVRGATLTITSGENQQVAMLPGGKVYSVHTLANNGNIGETYDLAAANVTGGGDTLDAADIKIYLDTDGNGVLNGTEGNTPLTSTSLAAGASAKLIVESVLPATMAASDTLKVTLNATDSAGTTASSINTVNITFTNSNISYVPKVWEQTAGGNCHAYAWIQKTLTWDQAKAEAETQMHNGKIGHLATITEAGENAFIFANVKPSSSAFLGGKKNTGTGKFEWITGELFSYTNWYPGEPNGSGSFMVMGHVDASKWDDISGSNTYLIEFDTDCALPSVVVELEGAKDVGCDGTADAAFGTARLADMYSGECAIMRSRATNNGESLAEGVLMSYTVPEYASYKADTLKFDGTAKTDAADTDNGTYVAATKKVQFNAGDLAVGAVSPDAEFSVVID